jgi:uncharacterized protein YuzE
VASGPPSPSSSGSSEAGATKVACDPDANVAYIRRRETQGDVEALRLTSDVLVDIDATGAVCGIELLDARAQLAAGDGGEIIVVDPKSGDEEELRVA